MDTEEVCFSQSVIYLFKRQTEHSFSKLTKKQNKTPEQLSWKSSSS